MGKPASGAAVGTDVAGKDGAGDEATVVLERVRLVDAALLPVGAAEGTRQL